MYVGWNMDLSTSSHVKDTLNNHLLPQGDDMTIVVQSNVEILSTSLTSTTMVPQHYGWQTMEVFLKGIVYILYLINKITVSL